MRKRVMVIALFLFLLSWAAGGPPPAAGSDGWDLAVVATAGDILALPAEPVPHPDELRVMPSLSVRAAGAARLHTGRGPWYLVVEEVAAGAELIYLGSREGWVLVRTPLGSSGWLASADALVSDSRGLGLEYRIQPGLWKLKAPSGVEVEVARKAPGVVSVIVQGLQRDIRVVEAGPGAVAVLSGGAKNGAHGETGGLDVGEGGVAAVSLTDRGILIDLEGAPLHQVLALGAGRVEVEFRPGLDGIERLPEGWRIRVSGDVRPVLRLQDGELVLDLPGAMAGSNLASQPRGVRIAEVGPEPAGGLKLRVPTEQGVFTIYRPSPGLQDLLFLPPGLAGKVVVLDPGHGGEETGAVGLAGHAEKDINLAVALRLKEMLESAGARAVLVRSEDRRALPSARVEALRTYSERTRADLEYRVALSNELGADVYLSLHGNGGPAGDAGIETYWAESNLNAQQSYRLAALVQAEMRNALGLLDRGVKQRAFYVLRFADAPAVLAELGFVTAPDEERLLASDRGQRAAAEALLRALRRYFEGAQG